VTVYFGDPPGSGLLMKTIDVLSDDCLKEARFFQPRQGQVGAVWLGRRHIRAAQGPKASPEVGRAGFQGTG